jgi:hypothetical protein
MLMGHKNWMKLMNVYQPESGKKTMHFWMVKGTPSMAEKDEL